MKRIFWVFLGGTAFLTTAHAASFDCEKASTKIEKLICSDESLSKLDDDLSAAYKSALQDDKQATAIRLNQMQWMKSRNKCSEIICIKDAYTTRIAQLTLETKVAIEAVSDPEMVRIPGKNYEMGKYVVTQKEWRDIMGNNPSHFSNCGDNCPVEEVSWNDIQEFLQKLNAKTGRQYRLPNEEEWEYACYGGYKTEYCGGNDPDSVAWYDKNSNRTTHPVGQKQANGYGLYDMSGNVWEWMQNESNGGRALRGGPWNVNSDFLRAADRNDGYAPANRDISIGFRLARTLPSRLVPPSAAVIDLPSSRRSEYIYLETVHNDGTQPCFHSVSAYQINASTGAITQVDSTPNVYIDSHQSVIVNPAGTFAYVVNYQTIRAYKINQSTGVLTEVERGGENGYGYGQFTVNSAGTFAYVTLPDTVQTYRINPSTGGLVRTDDSVNVGFNLEHITLNHAGTFAYVINDESTSSSIAAYKVNPTTGALIKVFSIPYADGLHAHSITLNHAGTLAYVGGSIRSAWSPSDNFILAYNVNPDTGSLTPVTGNPFKAKELPASITLNPAGTILYASNDTEVGRVSVYHINAKTGMLTEITGSPFATGHNPEGITFNHAGTFAYVTSSIGDSVLAYNINPDTGALSPISGNPSATGLGPVSVTVHPTGAFAYVPNSKDGTVSAYQINALTGVLTQIAGSPFEIVPNISSVIVNPAGTIAYMMNEGGDSVSAYRINKSTGALTKVTDSLFNGEEYISSVAINPKSNLAFVVHSSSGENTRYDPTYSQEGTVSVYSVNATTGAFTEVPGSPFDAGASPHTITINPAGTFAYVTNPETNIISAYRINTNGTLKKVSDKPLAAGRAPNSIVFNSIGTIAFVANGGSKGGVSAYSVNTVTGALTKVVSIPSGVDAKPISITINPTGTFVYVTNEGNDSISAFAVNAASGTLTPVEGGPFKTGASPKSVTINPAGTFAYLANFRENTVSAFSINITTGILTPVGNNPEFSNILRSCR